MISFVSEKLLSTLLDLFVGEVLKEVRANLDPKIQEIQNRLNIIESRMDKVQLLHLQSGLTSIRDGRADDALKEFEYAERADDYGAVARFWLSMMLRKRGREKEATAKLDEALSLNPFVVPLEFMGDRRVAKVPLQSFANPKPTKWGKRFDGEGTIMETVPAQESWGRWVWRGVERVVSKDNAQLLVGAVSTSGENPIVQWDVAYGTVPEKFTLFTLLRMEYGTVWRTRRFRDMNLLFAAPKHHVLESASSPKRFEFISAWDMKKVYEMSRTYFETAFFPDYSRRGQIPGYVDSNQSMSDAAGESVELDSYHTRYKKTLYDPFGTKAFRIDVYNYVGSNSWGTAHTSGTSPTSKARLQRLE